MKYHTKYKNSYERGSRNLSITISSQALDLMVDREIDNFSAFINDVLIEALSGEENFFTRQKLAEFTRIREDLEKDGYELTIQKRKV
jgi:hypothetical protein